MGGGLKVIENMDQLVLLQELWLGKNKIRVLEVGLKDMGQ